MSRSSVMLGVASTIGVLAPQNMLDVGLQCSRRHLLLGSPPLAKGSPAPGLARSQRWLGRSAHGCAVFSGPVEWGPARPEDGGERWRRRSATVAVFVARGEPPVLVEQGARLFGVPSCKSSWIRPRRRASPPPRKIAQRAVIPWKLAHASRRQPPRAARGGSPHPASVQATAVRVTGRGLPESRSGLMECGGSRRCHQRRSPDTPRPRR
jgi:hypothetical protein